MNASLTRGNQEISALTTTRMFMTNIGGLAVAVGVPVIVQAISPTGGWGTPEAAGAWQTTMTIFAAVSLVVRRCWLRRNSTSRSESLTSSWCAASMTTRSRVWLKQKVRTLAFFSITAFLPVGIVGLAMLYFSSPTRPTMSPGC